MATPLRLFLALSLMLAGCATGARVAPAPSAPQRLHALFAASDEARLKRSPLEALSRGDLRYADQFGDYIWLASRKTR